MAGLLDQPEQDYELVIQKLNVTMKCDKGIGRAGSSDTENRKQVYRNPVKQAAERTKRDHLYRRTAAWQSRTFWQGIMNGDIRKTYLLYGVTGSGKTEVYMEMIAKC